MALAHCLGFDFDTRTVSRKQLRACVVAAMADVARCIEQIEAGDAFEFPPPKRHKPSAPVARRAPPAPAAVPEPLPPVVPIAQVAEPATAVAPPQPASDEERARAASKEERLAGRVPLPASWAVRLEEKLEALLEDDAFNNVLLMHNDADENVRARRAAVGDNGGDDAEKEIEFNIHDLSAATQWKVWYEAENWGAQDAGPTATEPAASAAGVDPGHAAAVAAASAAAGGGWHEADAGHHHHHHPSTSATGAEDAEVSDVWGGAVAGDADAVMHADAGPHHDGGGGGGEHEDEGEGEDAEGWNFGDDDDEQDGEHAAEDPDFAQFKQDTKRRDAEQRDAAAMLEAEKREAERKERETEEAYQEKLQETLAKARRERSEEFHDADDDDIDGTREFAECLNEWEMDPMDRIDRVDYAQKLNGWAAPSPATYPIAPSPVYGGMAPSPLTPATYTEAPVGVPPASKFCPSPGYMPSPHHPQAGPGAFAPGGSGGATPTTAARVAAANLAPPSPIAQGGK